MTSKDIELIMIVKKVFQANNKIGFTRNKVSEAYHVQIGSVLLYRWLESIGLHSAKSKTLGPIAIPKEYFRDFLRGHLDGDGSITTFIDSYNTYKSPKYVYRRLFVRFISASKLHIEWINKMITEILDVHGRIHQAVQKNKNSMYILKFGKKESLKLLELLYYSPELPALERKRKIAMNFIDPTQILKEFNTGTN